MLIQIASNHPEMLSGIVSRTPNWVWGLLAGLIVLGLSQTRDRQAGLPRVLITPVAMTALALSGVVSVFGSDGQLAGVLSIWCLGAAVALALLSGMAVPAGTVWDRTRKEFELAGSWVPLALILCIFMTKYIVGVETAMDPSLSREPAFALTVSGMYGVFSGVFVARTLRLLRLVFATAGNTSSHAT